MARTRIFEINIRVARLHDCCPCFWQPLVLLVLEGHADLCKRSQLTFVGSLNKTKAVHGLNYFNMNIRMVRRIHAGKTLSMVFCSMLDTSSEYYFTVSWQYKCLIGGFEDGLFLCPMMACKSKDVCFDKSRMSSYSSIHRRLFSWKAS